MIEFYLLFQCFKKEYKRLGEEIRLLKSNLGKASQHHDLFVLNATLIPDINGACKTTPAQSYLDARSTVGTVPIDCPYKIIFEGLSKIDLLT
jgi:hypothetical protein